MKLRILTKWIFGAAACGVIFVAVILATVFVVKPKIAAETKIILKDIKLSVIIADTPASYEKGLSGHQGLKENEGMLFVFPAPVRTGFWMKDMLFPLDIIWFDVGQKIVDVWENASPNSYPEIRVPQSEAQFVLEVPAGFVGTHNVEIGDQFELAQ